MLPVEEFIATMTVAGIPETKYIKKTIDMKAIWELITNGVLKIRVFKKLFEVKKGSLKVRV